MIRPQGMALYLRSLLEKGLCSRIDAKVLVDISHDGHHAGAQLGVLSQAGAYFVGGFVQDLAGADPVSASLAGVGDLEHAGHEPGDAIGTIALTSDAAELDGL